MGVRFQFWFMALLLLPSFAINASCLSFLLLFEAEGVR